jgi:enoyl-CoA hydratase/carnithine racemase
MSQDSVESVLCERRGPVALVTLNRPAQRNALSRELLGRLGRIGRELLADSELRLVVVTGSGDRAFCAGADLVERATMNEDEVRAQLVSYRTELAWLSDPALPSLALLNGAALGGGLELALCCDFRLAHESALLGLVETSLGVIPGAGGTQRLPRLIGAARAKDLILRARRITAGEAAQIGLVHEVFPGPHEELLDWALRWSEPLLASAPLAARAALRAIDEGLDGDLANGLSRELEAYELCLTSEDRLEALAAFREKRRPNFRGR